MKYFLASFIILFNLHNASFKRTANILSLTKIQLRDKIMGGWAGQTIGAAFGGPFEFRYNNTAIQVYQKALWHDSHLREAFEKNPDLYDDIYRDLTFVEVLEKEGLNASVKSLAKAYANAEYALWHAGQIARYNVLSGIAPPASGHWLNNPHADDVGFQVEADFAGLMSPGMPQAATAICDKIGHIANYGDGYYGGVYIANLYALAFTSDRMDYITREAIKSIPYRSEFHRCISDVIKWHKLYPGDWRYTWLQLQEKWADDVGCPDGVYGIFDFDAKLNAAYVTLGLLYGNGDFSKTIHIATSAGQASGCNASAAAGILGVVLGYSNIPARWKSGLEEIETVVFKYTSLSLRDAYGLSFNHAIKMIEQNGGKVRNENVVIRLQKPLPVKWERSFEGHYPVEKRWLGNTLIDDQFEFDFEGIGFVVRGEAAPWNSREEYVLTAELYINNKFVEKVNFPVNFIARRPELFWRYQLPHNKYNVRIKILNPSDSHRIRVSDVVVYDVRNR